MKLLRMTIVLLLLITIFPAAATAEEKAVTNPLLIDVRTPSEWNEGHLDGAILIPYEKIGEAIDKVAPDRKGKINLYCRSGRRSGIALESLKKLGYENVTNLGSVKDASDKLGIPIIKGDK